jgi:hypothetical protein
MSNTEVIKTLYQLELHSNKGIKDYLFFLPEYLNVPGIYCFLSKYLSSYYIGSSVNILDIIVIYLI